MDISPGPNFLKFNELKVTVTGGSTTQPCYSFEHLGLRPATMVSLHEKGFRQPTPVQSYVIPEIQVGRDVLACSPTGSGKTAAFLIPIVDKLLKDWREPVIIGRRQNITCCHPHVLIITATRELAIQTLKMCKDLIKNTVIVALPAYGGTNVNGQISDLLSGCGAHILVATPGRLKHFLEEEVINFSKTRFLVLDEADKMLNLGFGKELKFIISHPSMKKPKLQRQTLMFSATYPEGALKKIEKAYLVNNVFMMIGQLNAPSLDVDEQFIEINTREDKETKVDKLLDLLWEEEENYGPQLTLIFVNRIQDAYDLEEILHEEGFAVEAISSWNEQHDREDILHDFRHKLFNVLVATDVMGRGLNIRDLKHVINYDVPGSLAEYVNRVGRTGRLGNLGKATSFFQPGRKEDEKLGPDLVWCLGYLQKEVPEFLLKYAANARAVKAAGRRRRR